MRVSRSGGWMSVVRPHSNRVRRRSSSVSRRFGARSGGDDDLLVGVVERVEGVEELFLGAFLALEELDVVDQQHVDVAVAALEGDLAVVAERVDEVVGELFAGDVPHPDPGEESLRVVADAVQQVGLAQTRVSPDEERVVGNGGSLCDRHGRRVREPVGRPDDERLEVVLLVQTGLGGAGRRRIASNRVGRPDFGHRGQRVGLLVDVVVVGIVLGLAVYAVDVPVEGAVQVSECGNAARRRIGSLILIEAVELGAGCGRGTLAHRHRQGDGQLHPVGQGSRDRLAQRPFDSVPGEAGRRRDQRRCADQADQIGDREPRPLMGSQ